MAMSIGTGGSSEPEEMVDINTTPLIDVMLVLLIMLIITIPLQTHAIKMNMPTGNAAAPDTPPEIVRIDIDFDGTIYWDGEIISDSATLDRRLQRVARTQPQQPEVHLRPNKLVNYRDVAAVMAAAQRLGVMKVGLVGNEQFAN